MSIEDFINEVKKLGINVTDEKLEKLDEYLDFLVEYNTHTNLTAITDPSLIYLKHFYDSLTIVKALDPSNYNNLLDIGTGAGFPGMVLKIFYPNLNVTLLDSNNKKTTFLTKLSEKLKIDVNIVHDRVENYAKNNLNKYDIVTSRAVANLRVLSELALPLVRNKGLFIAMKGNFPEEVEEAKDTIELMHGNIIKEIKFELIENGGGRNIIAIKKEEVTKEENLRPYDKIVKKPLVKKQ